MPQPLISILQRTSRFIADKVNDFRYRLAHADALPQLAILGCISGLVTGALAVCFRLSFELPLHLLLNSDDTESFESLSSLMHFLLPLFGAIVVGIILKNIKQKHHSVGVGHVVDRVHNYQGHLPGTNAIVQFVCGSLLLSTGNPVGREGPAVHLGAATASGLGKQMKLPNNNLRLLAGCGVAAAIAASFNTPLAGVIFAMEVVLMEYTIAGFIPIILAAVSGNLISRIVYGNAPAFDIPSIQMSSLLEIPYLILCGLAVGLVAAFILKIHTYHKRVQGRDILLRCAIAGIIAGSLGYFIPELLGLGYDTIGLALSGDMSLGLLVLLGLLKLTVASIIVTLGLPGGMVSPTFVSGACIGGALGLVGAWMMPDMASGSGFYAMLGMGAMMGAVLNAPLAALIAVLELTYNPNLLMPAMLMIVVSCITARTTSRLPGLFLIGRDPSRFASPVFQLLSRVGVTSMMNRNFETCSRHLSLNKAREILDQKPDWIVISDPGEPKTLLRPVDLAHYLHSDEADLWLEDRQLDLAEIPGQHRQLVAIHPRATLKETLQLIKQRNLKAAYVTRLSNSPLQSDLAGIITQEDIDNYYQ